jgi:transposase
MGQRLELTIEELYHLHERLGRQVLEPADFAVCGALVSNTIGKYEARISRLSAKAAAAAAAAGAVGDTGEDIEAELTSQGNDEEVGAAGGGDGASHDATGGQESTCFEVGTDAPATECNNKDGQKAKAPGHGRNGAAAYTKAKHFFHPLPDGIVGSLCICGAGPMHNHRETITIHIVGQPLFGAEAHHYQQGRCRICGKVATAQGPDHVQQGIGKSVVYGYPACAMLIVMHYFGGLPFKRLESFHEGWGIPLADANQWEVVQQSDSKLRPLFDVLERVGMQTATNLTIDDTGSLVISIRQQIKAEIAALERLGEPTKDVRNGINATGVRLETPQGIVILYFTGLHHAGEVFDRLMKHRDTQTGTLVKTTDGASKNFSHGHEDNLVEATCNAHAFLKFQAIKDKYPAQYAVAGEVYGKVFKNDTVARERGMTPDQRMAYHAKHSKPLMMKLRKMCHALIRDKIVEPNSALWEPVSFIINQWSRLTMFCEKPAVPLHTNLVEQILITPVRYLAGSFNYKTANGAGVGDRHMSLIASARANNLEPVAYVEHCLRNHEDLAKRPEYYLPWAYRDRLNDQPNSQAPPPDTKSTVPMPPPLWASEPRHVMPMASDTR